MVRRLLDFSFFRVGPNRASLITSQRRGRFLRGLLHRDAIVKTFPLIPRTSRFVKVRILDYHGIYSNSKPTIILQRMDRIQWALMRWKAVLTAVPMTPRTSWYVAFSILNIFDITSWFLPSYLYDEATNCYADFFTRTRSSRPFDRVQERLDTSRFGFAISMASSHL